MTTLAYEEAAHLLRRMGFGGTEGEIESLAARGREGAVDSLLNFETIDNSEMEALISNISYSSPDGGRTFEIDGEETITDRAEMRRWWLARMILTRRPFEEKMTLFWHNHFATSMAGILGIPMLQQHQTLRENLLGRFDDILMKISIDPAMLDWLNGSSNIQMRPNENYARELQELFTMGINDVVTGEPNYTEQDVKEMARALTGWLVLTVLKKIKIKKKKIKRVVYESVFQSFFHDTGLKTIYGLTANHTLEDVISIVANKRATGRFMAKKLVEFFVFPLESTPEDKQIIERFADRYFRSDHSIRALVREIFLSDVFFSERARNVLVKSPAELIASSFRMLGAKYVPRPLGDVVEAMDFNFFLRVKRMGQDLFRPPNVSGWRLGLGWLGTTTMLERYNFGQYFATSRDEQLGVTTQLLQKESRPTARETVEHFLRIFGPIAPGAEVVQTLVDYLETDEQGARVEFVPDSSIVDRQVRSLVHLIMCLQEFQFC